MILGFETLNIVCLLIEIMGTDRKTRDRLTWDSSTCDFLAGGLAAGAPHPPLAPFTPLRATHYRPAIEPP